jgi:hypothetical protein
MAILGTTAGPNPLAARQRRTTMTNDPGVSTDEHCAAILIDDQNRGH